MTTTTTLTGNDKQTCMRRACRPKLQSYACLYPQLMLKNYRFKHTCNDDNDIGRRKRQKLDHHIFTCKFPISYITMSADHDIVMMR